MVLLFVWASAFGFAAAFGVATFLFVTFALIGVADCTFWFLFGVVALVTDLFFGVVDFFTYFTWFVAFFGVCGFLAKVGDHFFCDEDPSFAGAGFTVELFGKLTFYKLNAYIGGESLFILSN